MLKKIKKILLTMIAPEKWGKLYEQLFLYINNIIRYRNFSFNLNSRRFWNEELSKFDNFWRDENYSHILDLLPKDTAFSLLDIGCAIGDGCELLQEKFPKAEITGIDISEIGIEKARQKTKNVHYFILDILNNPIPQEYDYIIIITTLEHFDKPFDIVNKCLKHVRKSLIISVPYTPFNSGKIIVVSEHRYCFNKETFKMYNSKIVGIKKHGKDINNQEEVIIYEIRP